MNMKKVVSCLLALFVSLAWSPSYATVTHFTETLPPAVPVGCVPVANSYDWGLSCNSNSSAPSFVNGVTGNLAPTSGTTMNYMVPVSSTIAIVAASNTIVPTGSYIVLAPSGIAATALTSTPSISTNTVLGTAGSPFPDGMFLTITGTSSVTGIQLQDNGTLAGSRLFLGPASGTSGTPVTFIIVSSTISHQFSYNASNNGWNLIH